MSNTSEQIFVSPTDSELLDLETKQENTGGLENFENSMHRDQDLTMKSKNESKNTFHAKLELSEDVTMKEWDERELAEDKSCYKKGKDLSKTNTGDLHKIWKSVDANSDISKLLAILQFPKKFLQMGGMLTMLNASQARNLLLFSKITASLCTKVVFVCMLLLHMANIVRSVAFCVLHIPYAEDTVRVMSLEALFFMIYGTAVYISEHTTNWMYIPTMLAVTTDYCKTFGCRKDLSKLEKYTKKLAYTTFATNIVFALIWTSFGMLNNTDYLIFPLGEVHTAARFLGFFSLAMAVIGLGIPIYGFLLLYTIIIYIIKSEFDETSRKMAEVLSAQDQGTGTERMFDHYRERHQFLCRIVATLSRLTRTYVVLTIFFDMVITCLSIYGLSDNKVTNAMVLAQIYNMLMSLVRISFICIKWSRLHTSAHSISKVLCDANLLTLPKSVLHKINLVLAQCTHNKIGIDVYGLFTIDCSTLMMIFGTLVTYGVVVIQFQLDSNSPVQCCTNTTGSNMTK